MWRKVCEGIEPHLEVRKHVELYHLDPPTGGLGFNVWGLGFRVLGFGVQGLGV